MSVDGADALLALLAENRPRAKAEVGKLDRCNAALLASAARELVELAESRVAHLRECTDITCEELGPTGRR